MSRHFQDPFGQPDCEAERDVFQETYQDLYFHLSPFNGEALDKENYLFIGRRGSGKSSLAHYLTFQQQMTGASCIDVNEPAALETVLRKMASEVSTPFELSSFTVSRIWEFIIWSLVFEVFKDRDEAIKDACVLKCTHRRPTLIVESILQQTVVPMLSDATESSIEQIERCLNSASFENAKRLVLNFASEQPIIVAIDTLEERNSTENQALLRVHAALIECASKFNTRYKNKGIHLKTFISAEIFPHLAESEISNTTKYIRNPVFLQWRPKPLLRLVAWRFFQFLNRNPIRGLDIAEPTWDDYQDVKAKSWDPFFGKKIMSARMHEEDSFAYVLRHTQLRPRQLVILCNTIAKRAESRVSFPTFHDEDIVDGVKAAEQLLATEILNSYSKIFPNVAGIVRALTKFPVMFKGKELDRVASSTASEWPAGDYSPLRFKQILTELGIVGRVRNRNNKFVDADFSYALDDTLFLRDSDDCVVHPMFYNKLSIDTRQDLIVFPFPDHPSFRDVQVKVVA